MGELIAKTLMDDTPQQALSWLSSLQQTQHALWQENTLPTRKTEAWKYTNLAVLKNHAFQTLLKNSQSSLASVDTAAVAQAIAIADLDAHTLVMINGVYCDALSSVHDAALTEQGVTLCRFADANPEQQGRIANLLNSAVDTSKHLFAQLNAASFTDGVFVDVPANIQMTKPIRVVNFSTAISESRVEQRVLVNIGRGAEATVIEHYLGEKDATNGFANSITELLLDENAKLFHYRLHQEPEHTVHLGGVHTNLAKHAHLDSFYLALGSRVKRLDIVVNHRGEGAHCEMNGVYLPRNAQHVDIHSCIEHAVPHCTTNEVFRGIIADQARAVFNGRIHIHKDAQKTLAKLSNKNLLTSNKAEVDTKPELEIYADDVQCAHGATVAQLDKTSLHYCKTRGISEADALVMLSFGFINELVDQIQHATISAYLRPVLAEMFSQKMALELQAL